jgi:hypothetical protein
MRPSGFEILLDSGGQHDGPDEPPLSLPLIHDIPISWKPPSFADDYNPERLKNISTYLLDTITLCSDLRADGETLLAERIEALDDLKKFDKNFIAATFSTRRAAKSRLRKSIFDEAVRAKILVPIPRRYKPTASARLKAVPDRKDARQGRLIYPCIRLNDACRKPDPTPLPRVPALVEQLTNRKWGWSCDIRSWFYHFRMADEVACK